MTVFVITPWKNGVSALLSDYANAVQGATIITIDNASDEVDAAQLEAFTTQAGGLYLRNEENRGFAAANNQGYAAVVAGAHENDIILFLNSDIAARADWLQMISEDVKHGALYGPSLQAQLVYGMRMPYLEGWCIAATVQTWGQLRVLPSVPAGYEGAAIVFPDVGPWDEEHYSNPYWEDNDLCLRAQELGIPLTLTEWPVQHKGGQTAGSIIRYGDAYERNRATYAARVSVHWKRIMDEYDARMGSKVYQRYIGEANTQSDIFQHLPLLYARAQGNVLELGTRTGVSTAALLAGVEVHGGRVYSVDIDDCGTLYAGHPQWTFIQGDSREPGAIFQSIPDDPVEDFDVMLIDTIHQYDHVMTELMAWQKYVRPGGVIFVHDTESFPGVKGAVREFCETKGWPVTWIRVCNGMAMIEVPK